jgi:hypothetical protein
VRAARLAFAVALAVAALVGEQRSIVGTVTEFRVNALQLVVKVDSGGAQAFPIGPDTEVVRVPPGETTLEHATPSRLVDIALGDRVLATFVDGLTEARRIVVVSLGDIARRNEAERADWQRRGVSGIVTACNGNEITVALRTAQAGQTAVIDISPKTKVRRYAEGSVNFTAAVPAKASDIAAGDQLQVRGEKSADGSRIAAQDLVFGTFLTKLGTITAANPESHEIEIAEAADGHPWKVHITAESQLKTLPDMRSIISVAAAGGHVDGKSAPHSPGMGKDFDFLKMLQSLPAAHMDDLKIGGGVLVSSAESKSGELTAIMLLANANALVQMTKSAAAGQAPGSIEALVRMHGGMLGSGSSVSLPAIIP